MIHRDSDFLVATFDFKGWGKRITLIVFTIFNHFTVGIYHLWCLLTWHWDDTILRQLHHFIAIDNTCGDHISTQ
ncbi:Uncharacterised protein [Vibrio cholerae]|uniref:Uncharacterized protein n=1 Tax=Vibrio cholerae TaxID=666 RepID=A0A655VVM9_VIBCL|nr:Uncharacterised protein [Vibrio cholerae]